MALIKCPKCGKQNLDTSSTCIYCGCDLKKEIELQTSPEVKAAKKRAFLMKGFDTAVTIYTLIKSIIVLLIGLGGLIVFIALSINFKEWLLIIPMIPFLLFTYLGVMGIINYIRRNHQ